MRATKKGEVTVYLETLNYWQEVTDSEPIAVFNNQSWANGFLKNHRTEFYNDGKIHMRYRAEVKE